MKMYVIPFRGLKIGEHQFDYKLRNEFFEVYHYEDILDADIEISLNFIKTNTILELRFAAKGKVKVACDISNERYYENIKAKFDLIVKFGHEFNDENDEILTIPFESYELDISQYIFEMVVLSLPLKKIHPGVKDGTLKSEILDKLKELSPKADEHNKNIDPRWEKLKDLLKHK
jgi:uncharacterized metal-binding protein YceD (DUF177 family)